MIASMACALTTLFEQQIVHFQKPAFNAGRFGRRLGERMDRGQGKMTLDDPQCPVEIMF
jgi:hypothetical protein